MAGYRDPFRSKPNYQYWLTMALWDLGEASHLLCDCQPDYEVDVFGQKWIRFKDVFRMNEIVRRAYMSKELKHLADPPTVGGPYVKPRELLKWANEKGLSIPKELRLDGPTTETERAGNVTDEEGEEGSSDVPVESKKEPLGDSSGGAQKVFPCKPETKWEEVKIVLIANDTVRIETPSGTGRFSYHQLGMVDKRKGDKPTLLWTFLLLLATSDGVISSNAPEYDPRLPDTAKRFNKKLKEIFGIDESIYRDHYRKHKEYRTKIKFENQTYIDSL